MSNQETIDRLRNDSRIVLRYWRTVENWSPADLAEARQALLCAVNAGGSELDNAATFYAGVAKNVGPLLVDQEPIGISVPVSARSTAKPTNNMRYL